MPSSSLKLLSSPSFVPLNALRYYYHKRRMRNQRMNNLSTDDRKKNQSGLSICVTGRIPRWFVYKSRPDSRARLEIRQKTERHNAAGSSELLEPFREYAIACRRRKRPPNGESRSRWRKHARRAQLQRTSSKKTKKPKGRTGTAGRPKRRATVYIYVERVHE